MQPIRVETPPPTLPPQQAPQQAPLTDSPPRIQALDRILSHHLASVPSNWGMLLSEALDPNAGSIEDRVEYLGIFLRLQSLDRLLAELVKAHHSLPRSFTKALLVDAPSSPPSAVAREPQLKPKVQVTEELIRETDKLGFASMSPEKRLATFLERFAFAPPSAASARPKANFTDAFYGHGLHLLIEHLVVHNHLFGPAPQQPFRLDPPAAASTAANKPPTPPTPPTHHAKTNAAKTHGRLEYYSKVLPIIQSSGYGKTRMCVQLSTLMPGMLVCLRKQPLPHEEHTVSFPPQDEPIFGWFDLCRARLFQGSDRPHERFNRAHLGVLAWLAVYSTTMAFYLEQLKHQSGCWHPTSPCARGDRQLCWQTVVYHLAEAIHSPSSGFIQSRLFRRPRVCPHSALRNAESTPAPASSSSPSPSPPSSPSPTHTPTPRPPPPPLSTTYDLRTQLVKHTVDAAEALNDEMFEQYEARITDGELLHTAIADHLRPALDGLERSAPESLQDALFFLALDECGTMDDLLTVIRRVWLHAYPRRSWILLVDTNSDLAPLAGPAAREASRRLLDGGTLRLARPFSLMPVDVNLGAEERARLFHSKQPTLTLRQLNSWLPKLGRPLWNDSIYHDAAGVVYPNAIMTKLVYPGQWPWTVQTLVEWSGLSGLGGELEKLDELNQNLLALASRRILLELTTTSGPKVWHSFVSHQIAQHLRYVGYISSDTETIVTSTVCEPPLSAAAAWFFRRQPEVTAARWSMIVQSLVNAKSEIGVSVGAEGEQGVALAATMAVDLAASNRYADELNQSMRSSSDGKARYRAVFGLVSVQEWLHHLVGDAVHTHKDDAASRKRQRDDDVEMTAAAAEEEEGDEGDASLAGFRRWAARTWINFSHVVRLPKQVSQQETMSDKQLLDLWFRRAAAQGVSNQAGWDLLIPVYEHAGEAPPDDDELFHPSRLSYVAVQVKNCMQRPDKETRNAAIGPFLTHHDGWERQCLELFFDLRGPVDHLGHTYSTRTHAMSPATASNRRSTQATQPAEEAEVGLTAKVEAAATVRHHVWISGSDGRSLPVLGQLSEPARSVVPLLFGRMDTLATDDFDRSLALRVRAHADAPLQKAFQDARLAIDGHLIKLYSD